MSDSEKNTEKGSQPPVRTDIWRPLDKLRQQIDYLFDDFNHGSGLSPFGRSLFDMEPFRRRELISLPAVDITEKENGYEIAAELPGLDEKDIEVKLSNGSLVIKGEKKEDRQEKKKGYHLSERHYGSFERIFSLPPGVETDKVEAKFNKGVLTISLPKKPEAINSDKVVKIKSN